jgi:hypothetical protein
MFMNLSNMFDEQYMYKVRITYHVSCIFTSVGM